MPCASPHAVELKHITGGEKTSGWRTRTAGTHQHTHKETQLTGVKTQGKKPEAKSRNQAGGVRERRGGGWRKTRGGGDRSSTDADAVRRGRYLKGCSAHVYAQHSGKLNTLVQPDAAPKHRQTGLLLSARAEETGKKGTNSPTGEGEGNLGERGHLGGEGGDKSRVTMNDERENERRESI